MFRSCIFGLLTGGFGLVSVMHAVSQETCRPALTFKEVRFSPMQPPTMERKWSAVLSVDASRCATTTGHFGIVFSRQKENGLEMDFQEQFTWKYASVEVSIDFWADEAVEQYWLYNVA